MKKSIFIIVVALLLIPKINAQNVPNGMKYQAVARDLSGDVLANQEVFLKIHLQSGEDSSQRHYTETHNPTTNQFGLFSIVIGEGAVEMGIFSEIPWSTDGIWMEIAIKDKEATEYKTISNSKLLAVPYAFHANTATEVTYLRDPGEGGGHPYWGIFGNTNIASDVHRLGTNDNADLIMTTNGIARMKLSSDGVTTNFGNFRVNSDGFVGGKLEVKNETFLYNNVYMNDPTDENTFSTINYGDFTVESESSTLLTGMLTVDKETDLNSDLRVNNEASTNLSGTLLVDGETDLNSSLSVNNQASTTLSGSLLVGEPDNFLGTSNPTTLNGQTTITWLETGVDSIYSSYPLRVFGSETGIAIKVWDDHPGPDNNWITFFNALDEPVARIEGNANVISDAITLIEALLSSHTTVTLLNGETYNLNDEVTKSFLKERLFRNDTSIAFAQAYAEALWLAVQAGVKLGITIPSASTLADFDDAIFLLAACIKSLYDAEKILLTGDQLGANFSSGGADYAEWLIKADPNEFISFGDVVGIKGGVISKTFTDADQFMAITSNPIIVGAMPEKGKENNFKKVALMGQVPVMVYGNVTIGDYILPSGNGDGTAIAVNPNDLRAIDFSKIIGVAWSASDSKKMFNYINTAVGFNSNQMGMVVNNMQNVINTIQEELVRLNPKYEPIYFDTAENNIDNAANNNIETQFGTCYEHCGDETFGIIRFKCYMLCWLESADVSTIDAEENAVIRLMRKLRGEQVDPRLNMITNALNDLFPDVQGPGETVLDKIPEIKDILLDLLDGPPYTRPPGLSTIIDKFKTRKKNIDYYIR
jgi:hypothetical protein